MGLFDKIKNALFEVEYVEVEDQPKKDNKINEHEEEILDEKPIAKKIVLPGKREDKVEKIQEEELIDQDFESRPKDDVLIDNNNNNNTPSTSGFRFMDDSDFTVEVEEEPQIIDHIDEVEVLSEPQVEVKVEVPKQEINASYSGVSPISNVEPYNRTSFASNYKIKERESRPYGMDPSYRVSIKEYGSYDNKDEKTYFKPSPIISPIYGILDKNYKKEDVVPRKDIRITSSYTRTNVSLDDIRNKAYGKEKEEEKTISKEEVVPEKEENLLVDLSDEKEKPEVKEITVGDAMEYFQDLGLEYNVDYVDASNKKPDKKKTDDLEEEIVDNLGTEEEKPEEKEEIKEAVVEEDPIIEEPVKEDKKVVEVIDEKKDIDATLSDDDNLFDLIDSMYKEDQ